MKTVRIRRESVRLLVNTGEEASCLNKMTYDRLKTAIGPLCRPETQYFAADGQKLRMDGVVKDVKTNWEGKDLAVTMLVLDKIANADGIAGMDFLAAAEAHIDCAAQKVTENPQQHSLTMTSDSR